MEFEKLLHKIEKIIQGDESKDEKLLQVCKVMATIPHYNWVGFYFVEGKELVLGPFVGEPTEHVRIAFGQGICGQAALKKEIFIVQDVSKENNYLACSPKVKAEIVIPIFKNGRLIGEIDIDSHKKDAFTSKDKKFLEEVAKLVSKIL